MIFSRSLPRRILVFSFLALGVLGVVGMAGIAKLLHRGLPDYAGTANLPGISAPVQVIRDDHAVPHIFADNLNDALQALGYIHASERMFQMEMQRRAGQGRLAEVIGKDMLGVDKFTRTLGLYHLAESSFAALSPEAQKSFQAYADGVNAWLNTHQNALPEEFFFLRLKPEPWKPADSIVWGKLMGLQLSKNYKLEALRGQLAGKVTPAQMKALFPRPPGTAPVTLEPRSSVPMKKQKVENEHPYSPPLEGEARWEVGSTKPPVSTYRGNPSPNPSLKGRGIPPAPAAQSALQSVYDQLGQWTSLGKAASNEWVISGARTESGKPILANDPHLGIEAPVLWYLARIVTPALSVKGATVPGLPVVLLGQNDRIAWGFTTTGSDVQDLFIETVDPENPDHYLTPDGSQPFETREEVIRVKGRFDTTLTVRTTRHGPVVSDIDTDLAVLAGKGKVMALAFTGLGVQDTSSEALMRINLARNWQEFLAALKLYQGPPQNLVYADTQGNIGFINPGMVPVRKKGNGLMPVDGASGAYDWVGTVPFTQLPQLYNPAAGFVFNANNAIGAGGMYFLGVDWEESYRAERLQEFFNTIPKHSLTTSAHMQMDHVSLAARELLPHLLHAAADNQQGKKALELLRGWDGAMDKNGPEPLIFSAWLREMQRLMAEKADIRSVNKAVSVSFMLNNDSTGWCEKGNCTAMITAALNAALDGLKQHHGVKMENWRWGDEHISLLRHKLFSHIPFLSRKSRLDVSSSGDFYTLDRGGGFDPNGKHPFARTHAAGFRGIYDLGNPAQSRFMIATGESGHIASPHYGDFVTMWNEGQYITLSGTRDELVAKGLPEMVFNPSR